MSTPDVIIETPRLLLRELEPDDLDMLAALYDDEEVMRYIGTRGVRPRAAAARYLDRQRQPYRERGYGEWATASKETGEMIGLCGLIVWPDVDGVEELEVAYLLARGAWGRGLATEAATAIRDHAVRVLGRDRLVSCIYPEHAASIRVAEKLGMRHEKDIDYEGQTLALYAWSAPAASA
jgi:RimJ/RimL family protein N-acetyltransferase